MPHGGLCTPCVDCLPTLCACMAACRVLALICWPWRLALAADLDSRHHKAYQKCSYALVAQLDRALASGAKGREFESRRAHHNKSKDLDVKNPSPFFVGKIVSNPISNLEPQRTTHLNVSSGSFFLPLLPRSPAVQVRPQHGDAFMESSLVSIRVSI